MAKIVKKKKTMINESPKSPRAAKRATNIYFRALMLEIVRKGLKTRNVLKPFRLTPFFVPKT